uniref:Uncharacterized protein n=1 Tax=Arundo donax TaxID=35708 RepID=A0A0A9F657_ARUDO
MTDMSCEEIVYFRNLVWFLMVDMDFFWLLSMNLQNMVGCLYLMETIALLPNIEILELGLLTRGHAIGPCVFHLLRISSGIERLKLLLFKDIKVHTLPITLSVIYCFGHFESDMHYCTPRLEQWNTEIV